MECRNVGSFMTSPPIALNRGDSLFRAVEVFHEKGISGAPVVDDSGYLVGILSESDLFRALRVHREVYRTVRASFLMIPLGWESEMQGLAPQEIVSALKDKKVWQAMTRKVITLSEDDSIDEAITLMRDKDVNRLPVVSGKKLVGIVTREDVIRCLASTR